VGQADAVQRFRTLAAAPPGLLLADPRIGGAPDAGCGRRPTGRSDDTRPTRPPCRTMPASRAASRLAAMAHRSPRPAIRAMAVFLAQPISTLDPCRALRDLIRPGDEAAQALAGEVQRQDFRQAGGTMQVRQYAVSITLVSISAARLLHL
jgi:hypothetical protein